MPEVKLPFDGLVYNSASDDGFLDISSAALFDGYVDPIGVTQRRPGLTTTGASSVTNNVAPIQGKYWWESAKLMFMVTDGSLYKTASANAGWTLVGSGGELQGSSGSTINRASFASDGTNLIVANGTKMYYTTTAATTLTAIGSNAPTTVSHVAFIDQYILANDLDTDDWYFSNVGDSLTWDALDFYSAEGKPDNLLGVHVGWREILLPGPKSVEIWYNDGSSPFSRRAFVEEGCASANTVQSINNVWIWMTDEKQIVIMDGQTPRNISLPIDNILVQLNNVGEAFSYQLTAAGQTFYVLQFPFSTYPGENGTGVTFAYNMVTGDWSRWTKYDSQSDTRDRFLATDIIHVLDWNQHFAGGFDGKCYLFDADTYQDNGDEMVTARRTGYVSHGTLKRKISSRVLMRLKRGTTATAAKVRLRWRDDGSNTWSNYREIDLGAYGDDDVVVSVYRLGVYRTRQYEISMSDNAPFILSQAFEHVVVLEQEA